MAAKFLFLFAAVHVGAVAAHQFLGGPGAGQQLTKASPAIKMSFSLKMLSEDPGLAELQGVEDSIEALMVKGGDPSSRVAVKQMSEFLVKTLIPIRERQLKLDQEQLDDHSDDIKQCSIEKAKQSDMLLSDKMAQVAEHKADYTKGVTELGDCLKGEEAKALVKDAHCTTVKDAEKKCMCHGDIVKAVGPSAACKKSAAIDAANKQCCDKFATYKLHQIQCQNAKHDMQYAQRQRAIIMKDVCGDYSTCYDKQLKEYKYVEKAVKENEEHRSMEKLYRIKCLVESFDKEKVTEQEVKACKEKKFDVKTIKYPETPAKAPCVVPQAL